ncbi:hypothetical protein ACB371_04165, partial [Klebsiella pneumoniae]
VNLLRSVMQPGALTDPTEMPSVVFAFIVKRFRVFRAPLQRQGVKTMRARQKLIKTALYARACARFAR